MVGGARLARRAGLAAAVAAILLFALFPFVQMLSLSLKYQPDWGNPSLLPTRVNWQAYQELLAIGQELRDVPESARRLLDNPELSAAQRQAIIDRFRDSGDVFPFLRYFRNSLLLSGVAALASLALATLGAYSFSRVRYRGRTVMQRGVLFVYMFGGILLVIPLFQLTVRSGLASTAGGTFAAILVIYLAQTLPVSLYMLGNYFRTISSSLEEAAMIDGCSRAATIARIIIPLALPALAAVFIYSFMIAWNEYLFASVFLKSYSDLHTLPLGLRALFTSKNAIWDRIMAGSMLTAAPVVALFMVVQKYMTQGLSAGGVKG